MTAGKIALTGLGGYLAIGLLYKYAVAPKVETREAVIAWPLLGYMQLMGQSLR